MSQTVAFAPLQSRALIAVGGADWRSFLQGLITQDVETLASGEARFGALLTPQGRLLYDLFVVGRDDGAWLDVEAAHRDAILMRLTMYRLRAKVELALDPTPVSILFADDGVPARPDGAWVADPRLPQLGFRGYGAAPPPNAATVAEADREAQKLRLGVPGPADWGADKTYPIEATIKNRMLPIVFDGPAPAHGTEVLAGDLRAGEVLSGRDGRAMALLRLDRALGAELTVDGRPAKAEVPLWMTEAVSEVA